jgi:cysteine-rich repeat protein
VDTSFEQCDGDSQQTAKAICVGGINALNACDSDSDCPGSTCGTTPSTATCVGVTARRCSNDRTIVCSTDTDCPGATATEPAGRCIAYQTARTRTCKNYGGSDPSAQWCTWNGWSSCQPVGFCGDGHVDAGEQCDDGNTSNNDSCTNACKTNVCGDGFYNASGGEECDLGTANGTRSCTADYGSTCLSCSATCRQVASSGGYCGNGVKEGSEQCDGSQGIGSCSGDSTRSCTADADCSSGQTCNFISCRSLGYDYARQVVCARYSYATNRTTGALVCVTKPCAPGTIPPPGVTCSSTVNTRCYACLGPGDCNIDWHEGSSDPRATDTVSAELADSVCKPDPVPCTSGICLTTGQPPRHDLLSCAPACSLTGCQRCVDSTGSGSVTGQVMDALYSFLPVPNARVTLYNRGVRVKEVIAGKDGRFTIDGINSVSACTDYHIVVDYYQDNQCTGSTNASGASGTSDPIFCGGTRWSLAENPNEAENGGYWPYTSDNFGVNTFFNAGIHNNTGRIYLVPRVPQDETLVVHTWNGSLPDYVDAHLIVPEQQKFQVSGSASLTTPSPTFNTYTQCAPGDSTCTREIRYGNQQGNPDMSVFPHANLYCYTTTTSGGLNLSCNSFRTAPQTMKFKKGTWATTGKYSFYLVDYSGAGPPPPSYQYFDYTSSSVRIVTHDNIYTVDAPTVTTAPCTATNGESTSQSGKYWLVFQEDAQTGAITIPSTSVQLRCGGNDSLTNTPGLPASNLPAPMSGT